MEDYIRPVFLFVLISSKVELIHVSFVVRGLSSNHDGRGDERSSSDLDAKDSQASVMERVSLSNCASLSLMLLAV